VMTMFEAALISASICWYVFICMLLFLKSSRFYIGG
jgi:hypothetical protein